jgi:hypothetical protein
MSDHERERALVRRADVDEVNVEVIDLCPELRKLVQLRFGCSPVVFLLPVGAQVTYVVEGNPL